MSDGAYDDVERSGPFVFSKMARAEITRLRYVHGLSYTHNPGGGEFYRGTWRCQIGCCDDLADLAKLRDAVTERPPKGAA